MAVMSKLAMKGFASEMLKIISDGDTNCGKVCNEFFNLVVNLACSNHINKNLGKCICRVAPGRPKGCVCHKKKRHCWSKHCGCINASVLVRFMKAANMKILRKAGERKDPDYYRRWLTALEQCIFEDTHTNCAHHDEHENFKTPPKCRVTCPHHRQVHTCSPLKHTCIHTTHTHKT